MPKAISRKDSTLSSTQGRGGICVHSEGEGVSINIGLDADPGKSAISEHFMSMETRSEFSLFINGELGSHFSFSGYDSISQDRSLRKYFHPEGDESMLNEEIINENPERDFSVITNQGITSEMNSVVHVY